MQRKMERLVLRHFGKFAFGDEFPRHADGGIGGRLVQFGGVSKLKRSAVALACRQSTRLESEGRTFEPAI